MSYLVLARKWRPATFDELVGQEHVTRALENASRLDRVAHAFLFTGARGVGKTTAEMTAWWSDTSIVLRNPWGVSSENGATPAGEMER